MRVLVTGSNGFIGKYITKTFSENGYEVVGVGLKKESNNPYISRYFNWDMGHEPIPEEILHTKVNCIIHAAASLDKTDDNIELIYSNCIGTFRVYELAKSISTESVILLSGVPILGLHCNQIIDEKTVPNPETMYHATKASQEFILNQLSKTGIRICSLRIPSPIGPGQPEKTIVPIFVRRAMNNEKIILSGKGTRRQNYVDVRDIADCISFLCKTRSEQGTFVIGSEKTVSNYELAELCIKLARSSSNIVFNGKEDQSDDDNWTIDCSKLKDEGFELRYSIENTICDMIDFNKSL